MLTAAREEDLQARVTTLSRLLDRDEWTPYQAAIEGARRAGYRMALGGGLALHTYSGRWRDTKDVDLFILPRERDAMVGALRRHGFADLYEEQPYDRTWIYRGVRDGAILDLIWTMPNHRMEVDEGWLERGPVADIHGTRLRLVPVEEYLWSKIYVLQRDRCDWPDLLNVLRGSGARIDWRRLLRRLGDDAPLLGGLLTVYRWMCPADAARLPAWLWHELQAADRSSGTPDGRVPASASLLDTREWFGPPGEGDAPCR